MTETTTQPSETAAPEPSKEELVDFLQGKMNRNLEMYFQNCQRCGLCAEGCQYYQVFQDPEWIPAYKTQPVRNLFRRGKEWYRKIIPGLKKDDMTDVDLDALADVVYGKCTMCRRCTITCPMGIDVAIPMRAARGMLTKAGKAPKGLQDTVNIHVETGNNMGLEREELIETTKWMEEELQMDIGDPNAQIPIDVEGSKYLWTLNPREVKFYPLLLQAQAKVFYAAEESYTLGSYGWDVTNYALFNGDDVAARTIASYVLAEVDRLGVEAVVATECGHGFRALKYLAPIWCKRKDLKVRGFLELAAEYIRDGRIKLDPTVNKDRVTYHDPCNQARSGGIIDEPRYILKNTVMDFVELEPHGSENWCCGGGGGALTMSEFRSRRLDVSKLKADQIRATGAKIVATSCHNCLDQLMELNRHYKLGVEVKNLCELLADALVLPVKAETAAAEQ